MKMDVVLLYSGGADSLLMLHFAREMGLQPYCVLIDYEQKHKKELDVARSFLASKKIPYRTVEIKNLGIDSGLTGSVVEQRWDNVHPKNVPARNTIFLGIAMGIAEHLGAKEVWIGCDYSDRENLFPDCYQEYIKSMNDLTKYATATSVKVVAPLLGFTKEMVIQYLEKLGYSENDYFSGYGE